MLTLNQQRCPYVLAVLYRQLRRKGRYTRPFSFFASGICLVLLLHCPSFLWVHPNLASRKILDYCTMDSPGFCGASSAERANQEEPLLPFMSAPYALPCSSRKPSCVKGDDVLPALANVSVDLDLVSILFAPLCFRAYGDEHKHLEKRCSHREY